MLLVAALAAAGVAASATGSSAIGLIGARAAHRALSDKAVAHGTAAHEPEQVAVDPRSGFVPRAVRASVENGADAARLTFDLARPVPPGALPLTVFTLADPDRVIVDLPRTDFAINPVVGKPGSRRRHHWRKGMIASFRFGLLAAERSRIVVDLGGPARVLSASLQTTAGKSKLVISLARTDRASFRAASHGPILPVAKVVPLPPEAPLSRSTIVIDPGHGGPDTGAIVHDVVEKNIALAFGKLLARKLEASGRFNVVMTRATDVFIPLSERVRIAREANAALMISIHADTLTESSDVGGATVYTVSDRASDAYAAKVAAKENAADSSVGVDGQADVADVNDILFDLTRQETRAYSHVFARTLVNYWKVVGRLNKNPQRAAGFVVLKAPDVPSVLLELGYLSNSVDATELTSDAWREKATSRMAEAIFAYFADRHGPAKAAAGVPIPLKQADAGAANR